LEASRDGDRSVPVGVRLHDGKDGRLLPNALHEEPEISRDGAEVDDGASGSQKGCSGAMAGPA
jgi:hypothetical protein